MSGTVTDSTGAVVPNASVTATEVNTNSIYKSVTSQAGLFDFPQLSVGTYDVTVSAPNFQSQKRTGVPVQINTAAVVNVTLPLGQESQSVTVTESAPSVESTTSDIGGIVITQQVEELPLSLGGVGAFRSPEAFTFLLPGVVGPGTANNSNGIYIQKTSGGQNFGDDVILDGSRRPTGQQFYLRRDCAVGGRAAGVSS